MLVDIRQLSAGYGGNTFEFSQELDLSAVRLFGENPFDGGAKITGTVRNRAGIITFRYTADYAMTAPCARCLEQVTLAKSYSGEHIVMETGQDEVDEDAYAPAPGGILNVDELILADLVLSLEGVMLCDDACKGLCPKCGKNLNQGDCGCVLREPDPRFDALR